MFQLFETFIVSAAWVMLFGIVVMVGCAAINVFGGSPAFTDSLRVPDGTITRHQGLHAQAERSEAINVSAK